MQQLAGNGQAGPPARLGRRCRLRSAGSVRHRTLAGRPSWCLLVALALTVFLALLSLSRPRSAARTGRHPRSPLDDSLHHRRHHAVGTSSLTILSGSISELPHDSLMEAIGVRDDELVRATSKLCRPPTWPATCHPERSEGSLLFSRAQALVPAAIRLRQARPKRREPQRRQRRCPCGWSRMITEPGEPRGPNRTDPWRPGYFLASFADRNLVTLVPHSGQMPRAIGRPRDVSPTVPPLIACFFRHLTQ
jgi:hypothetical protein